MTHRQALEVLAAYRGRHVVITTHGSVDLQVGLSSTPLDFAFVPTSMGQAPSLGLGIALAQTERGVVVVNGDGAMLMNLGSLVTIAANPANLFLIIIDNGVYEVTGGQVIAGAGRTDFVGLARAAGIHRVYSFETVESWSRGAGEALSGSGPAVIRLQVEARPGQVAPTLAPPMAEQLTRLKRALIAETSDARAWRASTIDERSRWYHPLTERCLSELDQAIRRLRREPRPVLEVRATDYLDASLSGELEPVLTELERGRGFSILEGVPAGRDSVQELQTIYWLVGQLLGRPFEQNVQGTLLYDVLDEGKDVRYGARFSVTNAETGFHTDNSFGETVLDYVGLLCLSTAKSGGLNQVVSGYTLHNELRTRHPDVLAILSRPFHIERRGGLRPGDAPTISVPILSWDGQELICRYLRYWIDAGQEKAGEPLTSDQKRALDTLDAVLAEPDLHVEFGLKPGDMFFINNRCIFHNRSAFEDHVEPERRRHYIRLWLRKNSRIPEDH